MTAGPEARAVLRGRVAELVAGATDGEVTEAEILASGGSLTALGVTSLAFLRLIDTVEEEFGVILDLDGPFRLLDDLDGLVDHIGELTAGGGDHG
ncbi:MULTISPECIES: acyl carrier protein [Streptomyces]|uniref:Acyl carrier protein n=1 Tax=Streptomyces rhizosphaericola TaxID=2564098 RepID=A0ABY2PAS0_9ACTN|nr:MULTISPECIES: acyl carrier protein [Streptomyces]MYT92737.1 acyl carrier protein [Streptomyces sp. SID8359]MYT96928.1 acyl carrier protein [Streptomyces sp. SID8350]NGO87552.1 acyl carrier protein [Streptomyces sp. 196(2019)]PWS46811.1 acyl carrier protein [Streptomyces sp. ZEA17I]TGZ05971.1 acyl carrier protein [Streptomyces rhizosphaericola]